MRARARTCVCARALPASAPSVRALHAAVELRTVGSQVFHSAMAFNANIGAWNTARVKSLDSVCAAFGRRSPRRGGRAESVFDAAWPLSAARMCVIACVYVHEYI